MLSIAVGYDNTIIYYDHWEHGYDKIPGTSSTTLVFGDRDLSNGAKRYFNGRDNLYS